MWYEREKVPVLLRLYGDSGMVTTRKPGCCGNSRNSCNAAVGRF